MTTECPPSMAGHNLQERLSELFELAQAWVFFRPGRHIDGVLDHQRRLVGRVRKIWCHDCNKRVLTTREIPVRKCSGQQE